MSSFWKVCSFLCTQYLVGPPFQGSLLFVTYTIIQGIIGSEMLEFLHELLHQCGMNYCGMNYCGMNYFCMNYCINVAWHGVDQPVALLRCNEAQVALIAAFRSSALLGLVSLIFLLTIPSRLSMGFRFGEFAGQSSTVTSWSLNQLLVPLAVWAGAKSCWKMKSASP